MKVSAIVCAVSAGLALAVAAVRADSLAFAGLSLALSALWTLSEARGGSRATAFLIGFVILSGLQASSGEGLLLPTLAVIAALHGWDISLAAARLAGFSREETRQITRRYGLTSAILAASSLGLVTGTGLVRIPLGFGVAVALSVALLSVSVTVGVLSRPRQSEPSNEAEAVPGLGNEKVGRPLSPDPDLSAND